MNKLSEQLESFKQGVIEYIKSYWDFDYEYEFANDLLIVEPGVLQTDERVFYSLMEELAKGTKNSKMYDDCGVMIEYVEFKEFVRQLDRDELIAGLMNMPAIHELEAKYSYSIHLQEKIESQLHSLDLHDIHTFTDRNPYITIHPSTGEIEIDDICSEGKADCICYDTEQFVSRGSDYNVPERNIFCGHQFIEASIHQVTEEEFAEWRSEQYESEPNVSDNDLPF